MGWSAELGGEVIVNGGEDVSMLDVEGKKQLVVYLFCSFGVAAFATICIAISSDKISPIRNVTFSDCITKSSVTNIFPL